MVSLVAIGQTIDEQGNAKRAFKYLGGAWDVKARVLPVGNHDALYPNLPLKGRIQVNESSNLLEYHNGTDWITAGSGSGDGCAFTPEQCAALKALVYSNYSAAFTVTPATGERGVNVPLTLNYNIASNNDNITAASISQGIGSVLSNVNTGAKTVSGGSKAVTTAYVLTIGFTRNGSASSETRTVTYTPNNPQWAGVSSAADFTASDYAAINGTAGFTKYLQGNSVISKAMAPTAQYMWFIVTAGTGTITGNGFTYSIGSWGDSATFFWRKPLTITLADGSNTATVYLIRTRELQNSSITFIHN